MLNMKSLSLSQANFFTHALQGQRLCATASKQLMRTIIIIIMMIMRIEEY